MNAESENAAHHEIKVMLSEFDRQEELLSVARECRELPVAEALDRWRSAGKTADINHFRRCIASAKICSVDPSFYIAKLKALGAEAA
jgi:hypothetical protein